MRLRSGLTALPHYIPVIDVQMSAGVVTAFFRITSLPGLLINGAKIAITELQYPDVMIYIAPGRVVFKCKGIVQSFISFSLYMRLIFSSVLSQQASEIISGIVSLVSKFRRCNTEFRTIA